MCLYSQKAKLENLPSIKIGNKIIDVTYEYNYLGLLLNCNGIFIKDKSKLLDIANNITYASLRKTRSINLFIVISLELFDKLFAPVLLYGSEVWGHEPI